MRPVLITGGAGFIGTNLAHRLLGEGTPVILFDNLSRPGVTRNLRWLRAAHPGSLTPMIADVRDRRALQAAVRGTSAVFHCAAQVAVTTSLESPTADFEINAGGTLNLLEAIREQRDPPPLVFTSTNKVYGALSDVELTETERRYVPADPSIRLSGIHEGRPLDFHSPYGCSKGAADQYLLDYARSFGLRTIVFRMSCIYGPHQLGTEDQGWVAHFLRYALEDRPITLYGDGKQVRDVLFVEDLVNALLLALRDVDRLSGQAFNLGGGPGNTLSLLELLEHIRTLNGSCPPVRLDGWRAGDQRYYVSDTRKFRAATGWAPAVDVATGLSRLQRWLLDSRHEVMAPEPEMPQEVAT